MKKSNNSVASYGCVKLGDISIDRIILESGVEYYRAKDVAFLVGFSHLKDLSKHLAHGYTTITIQTDGGKQRAKFVTLSDFINLLFCSKREFITDWRWHMLSEIDGKVQNANLLDILKPETNTLIKEKKMASSDMENE